MNFIRINCRLKELGEMQFTVRSQSLIFMIYFTFALILLPYIVVILNYSTYLLPYTIYELLLSSKLIENGNVKNWRCETQLTVTKSHPIPIHRPPARSLDRLTLVRCSLRVYGNMLYY